jgi:glutamine amidotransferase
MIGVLDYGSGNVKAFINIYKKMGIPTIIIKSANELRSASKLILPGVGSFDYAMHKLRESGMRQVLDEIVLRCRVPIIGVCVGMQMLAHSSEEGNQTGLGWIDAEVKKFDTTSHKLPMNVPHIGWNDVKPLKANHLLEGLERGARFYFLHSYYMVCHRNEEIVAITEYGTEFACVVNQGNIYGVQFHPEKSHQWGIQLLKNFASL